MKKHSFAVPVFAILAGLSGALMAQQPDSAALKGDAAKGKQYFLDYTCYACHGFSAQNGPGRNRLNPMKMTTAGFIGLVRKPTINQMPSYSAKVISDQKLADIWSYLKTLPNAPPAKDIPLLQQIKSEAEK